MKAGGKSTTGARARGKPDQSWRGWTIALIAAAACQLLILWFAQYSPHDLDDKAIHYYSAARLFADEGKIKALDAAEPTWLNTIPVRHVEQLKHHLHTYATSPFGYLLIRGFCALAPGDGPPVAYTFPVKLSFLLLFLLALGWLIGVTYQHDLDAVLVMACLLMAALNLCVSMIAPVSDSSVDFLSYVPQGSATLLILAAFACFSRGNGILAAISLLLAACWHTGFAAAVVPCTALAFGLTLIDRAGSAYVRSMAAILMVLCGVLLNRFMPGTDMHYALWIPLFFTVLVLLIGPMTLHPAWRATASLAAFLFLTLALDELIGVASFRNWLMRITGSSLVSELPVRLTAIRHLASLALPIVIIIGLLNRILPSSFSDRPRRIALLGVTTLGLIVAYGAGMPKWPQAARHLALFIHAEDEYPNRPSLSEDALSRLDPRREREFFVALGDFLLDSRAPR